MMPFRLGPDASVHPDRAAMIAEPALVELPPGESIAQVLDHHARRRPEAAFGYFVDAEGFVERVSHREAYMRAESVAAKLAEAAVRPGARVVLALPTSFDLLASFVACQLLGAVPCIVETPPGGRGLKLWVERLAPKLHVIEP